MIRCKTKGKKRDMNKYEIIVNIQLKLSISLYNLNILLLIN